MSKTILNAENVSFGYESADVLHDVSLKISRGEVFCLLGPNGSGKTTLLDCFLGINKPRSGKIVIDGADISGLPPSRIARRLAYIPQNHKKNFPFTVFDVVLMGRTAYTGFFDSPDRKDKETVSDLIDKMNLTHLKNRDYTRISGGESQLVLIMRALVQEAPLLVMDEPSSHLDFRNEMLLLEMIVDIIKEGTRSVVLTTHSPYIAFFLENSGIPVSAGLIDNGRLIKTGTPSGVLNPENMKKVFGVETAMTNHIIGNSTLKSIIPIKTIQEKTDK